LAEQRSNESAVTLGPISGSVQAGNAVYSSEDTQDDLSIAIDKVQYGVAMPLALDGPTLKECDEADEKEAPPPPPTTPPPPFQSTVNAANAGTGRRLTESDCSNDNDVDGDCWDWAMSYDSDGALFDGRSIKDACTDDKKADSCARTCCVQKGYYDSDWGGGGYPVWEMHDLAGVATGTAGKVVGGEFAHGWTVEGQCTGWDNNTWLNGNGEHRAQAWWPMVGGNGPHAEATFVSKADPRDKTKYSLALHFSNMDSLYDMARYVAEAKSYTVPNSGGLKVSQGFADYIEDLEPCLTSKLRALKAEGKGLSYIVGKALGGAVGTVYASMLKEKEGEEWPVYGVWSFAAPETHVTTTTRVPGYRFFHATDPIPGVTAHMSGGIMKHNIENVCYKPEKITTCVKTSKSGKCKRTEAVSAVPVEGSVEVTSVVTWPLWAATDEAGKRKWFKKADPKEACQTWPDEVGPTCRTAIKLLNKGDIPVDDWKARQDFAFGLLFFHIDDKVVQPFVARTPRAKDYYQRAFPIPFAKKYGRNGMAEPDVADRGDSTTWMEMCHVKSCALDSCRF